MPSMSPCGGTSRMRSARACRSYVNRISALVGKSTAEIVVKLILLSSCEMTPLAFTWCAGYSRRRRPSSSIISCCYLSIFICVDVSTNAEAGAEEASLGKHRSISAASWCPCMQLLQLLAERIAHLRLNNLSFVASFLERSQLVRFPWPVCPPLEMLPRPPLLARQPQCPHAEPEV